MIAACNTSLKHFTLINHHYYYIALTKSIERFIKAIMVIFEQISYITYYLLYTLR